MIKKAGSLLRQPSSKSAAPAGRSVPLQRPSARLSVSTKPRAVTKGAGDTTFATSVRPPSRQSVTSKAAALSKPGSAFVKASQPAQNWAAPSALAAPRQQATPAVPELPRRSVVPRAGASTASRRSLQPVKGTVGTTARAPARLSTVPDSGAQRTFLHGSRRSVATIRKATTTTSQAVPAELPKAPTGPQAASTAQPSRLAPRSRLRPPTSRASGSTSRVPRPAAFREASCLPQVPESPVAGRLSSTPARPDVPRCGSTPTLTPIRKQPDWR
nr:protein app1-like [Rhipicephalus microplus]